MRTDTVCRRWKHTEYCIFWMMMIMTSRQQYWWCVDPDHDHVADSSDIWEQGPCAKQIKKNALCSKTGDQHRQVPHTHTHNANQQPKNYRGVMMLMVWSSLVTFPCQMEVGTTSISCISKACGEMLMSSRKCSWSISKMEMLNTLSGDNWQALVTWVIR